VAKMNQTQKTKLIAAEAVALAEYAALVLAAAKQRRIKTNTVEQFPLDKEERATVAEIPSLPAKARRRSNCDPTP
jgi:hypothetical protein